MLPEWKPGDPVRADRLNRMQVAAGVAVAGGAALTQSGGGQVVTAPRGKGAGGLWLWARITGSAGLQANRWGYGWAEAVLDSNLPDGWVDRIDGRTNETTGMGVAYNLLELPNPDGPGLMGNGVDTSRPGFPAAFTLQPITTGVVVQVHLVRLADGSEWSAWFASPNAVDGACGP